MEIPRTAAADQIRADPTPIDATAWGITAGGGGRGNRCGGRREIIVEAAAVEKGKEARG
jgi:hypothetical protein